MSNRSKERPPSNGITISPSRTNCAVLSLAKATASSGKYRARGLPAFDCRSTFFRSRKARQRNPSHLGSYCHWGPVGRTAADRASIGGYVLEIGSVTEPSQSSFGALHSRTSSPPSNIECNDPHL